MAGLSVPENTAKVKGYLFGAVAVGGAAAWFQPDVAGSDLWWHLAAGRAMWADSSLPCCDTFSFTFHGREWLNHEWLWDAISWPAFAHRPETLWALHFGLLVLLFAAVLVRCRRVTSSWISASIALWCVAATTHWFLDVRPHLFTLLFLQGFLLTRRHAWAPWAWPALVAVWANLHAGFAFGLGALGLYTLIECARTLRWPPSGQSLSPRRARRLRHLCLGTALALAAAGANPWGYHIFVYPFSYLPGMQENPYRALIEWHPPGLGWSEIDVRGWSLLLTFQTRFWLLALAAAVGSLVARRRVGAYLVLLSAITLCMAATSRRFIPLFAVTAAPLVACSLDAAWPTIRGILSRGPDRWRIFSQRLQRPVGELLWLLPLGVAATALWAGVRLFPDPLGRVTQRDLYPAAAVRELSRLSGNPRVFNHYSWGGFVMLHAPDARVFIDGRANTLYDGSALSDLKHVVQLRDGYTSVLERHRVEVALLPHGALSRALRDLPEAWVPLHEDAGAVLLAAPGFRPEWRDPTRGAAADARGPRLDEAARAQRLQRSARTALQLGQLDTAIAHLERALEADPIAAACYLDLVRAYALQGDPGAVARTLRRAERALPRRRRQLASFAGELLLQLGRPESALPALERGLGRGPFDDARRQVERIRSLAGEKPSRERAGSS